MANNESMHDQNEKAFREAMREAQRLPEGPERDMVTESIKEFYDLIRSRIERGVYSDPPAQHVSKRKTA